MSLEGLLPAQLHPSPAQALGLWAEQSWAGCLIRGVTGRAGVRRQQHHLGVSAVEQNPAVGSGSLGSPRSLVGRFLSLAGALQIINISLPFPEILYQILGDGHILLPEGFLLSRSFTF